MHYKIAICDDSPADQDYISGLTKSWAAQARHTVQISVFSSAESFLFCYAGQKDFDILLLDIEMAGMDGVALAKKLRQDRETAQIVFITGYPEFIAQGYEVAALHYLLKPVSGETLAKVLGRAAANLGRAARTVVFTVNKETVRVATSDILYIEAFAHSCQVHTSAECFEIRQGISELEKMLGDGFIRTHRSYLVGIACMERISKSEVTLDNGEKVPLSRGNYQAVNQAFIRYYMEE